MNHFPQAWGRPRDDVYGHYDHSYLQNSHPNTHTQQPIVTGTSVIAAKFATGVVIAADNLASYGSLARFTTTPRLQVFNSRAVLGFGGDVSDMQSLSRTLSSLSTTLSYSTTDPESSTSHFSAANLHTYLSKLLYKRRSEMNPLWNHILVAGLAAPSSLTAPPPSKKEEQEQQKQGGQEATAQQQPLSDKPAEKPQGEEKEEEEDDSIPFLASVDLLGTTFSSPTLATGFGSHLAQPILRRLVDDENAVRNVTREQAVAAVRECMKVLWYRDARSMDEYSMAVIEKGKDVVLDSHVKVEDQSWAFAEGIRGYGTQTK